MQEDEYTQRFYQAHGDNPEVMEEQFHPADNDKAVMVRAEDLRAILGIPE